MRCEGSCGHSKHSGCAAPVAREGVYTADASGAATLFPTPLSRDVKQLCASVLPNNKRSNPAHVDRDAPRAVCRCFNITSHALPAVRADAAHAQLSPDSARAKHTMCERPLESPHQVYTPTTYGFMLTTSSEH